MCIANWRLEKCIPKVFAFYNRFYFYFYMYIIPLCQQFTVRLHICVFSVDFASTIVSISHNLVVVVIISDQVPQLVWCCHNNPIWYYSKVHREHIVLLIANFLGYWHGWLWMSCWSLHSAVQMVWTMHWTVKSCLKLGHVETIVIL
jgi:hypothetical protein